MLPTISIDRAADSEVEQVTLLLKQQLEEHGVSISVAALQCAVRGIIQDEQRGFVLVARCAEHGCVGVASVSFIWALEHGGKSAWLEELFVAPSYRCHGIGAALLAAVEETSTADGCAALDVEIDVNHERVRSLYERTGFRPLPRRRIVKQLKE